MAVELAKCRAAKMLRPATEIGLGHLPVEALYYVRNQCLTQSPRSLDRSCYANGSRDDPTQRHRGREIERQYSHFPPVWRRGGAQRARHRRSWLFAATTGRPPHQRRNRSRTGRTSPGKLGETPTGLECWYRGPSAPTTTRRTILRTTTTPTNDADEDYDAYYAVNTPSNESSSDDDDDNDRDTPPRQEVA